MGPVSVYKPQQLPPFCLTICLLIGPSALRCGDPWSGIQHSSSAWGVNREEVVDDSGQLGGPFD